MTDEGKAKPAIEISRGLGTPLRSALGDKDVSKVLGEVKRYAGDVASDLRLPAPRVEARDLAHPLTGLTSSLTASCAASRLPVTGALHQRLPAWR